MLRFCSEPPKVRLTKVFQTPFDNAVATARTCYSSRIVTDEDIAKKPALRDRIARSIYLAGHHTTLQHAHFQFAFENVSRQALWSFFHAHPFYNSEQVSQRYVEVRPGAVIVPALGDSALDGRYQACVERQMATYRRLLTLLEPAASAAYYGIFPARKGRDEKRYRAAIQKRCQEVARYVLPIGTFAHLYHTVSGLTLHRYHRVAKSHDCPSEQALIVEAMVREVEKVDPLFFRDVEETLPLEETHEERLLRRLSERAHDEGEARRFCEGFDASLEGKTSKLIGGTERPERVLADAVREAFGLPSARLSDEECLALLLDPAENRYLGESLTLTTLSKATRALELVHFTFRKKLSHTADSQAQRHRMTPGVRPRLVSQIVPGEPDYVTPMLFEHELAKEAKDAFVREMEETFEDIRVLEKAGVSPEAWQYLLPNAVPVRFTETGSLLDHHHKWTTRLCFNAQEEIWRATLDEVSQVADRSPALGRWLLPPCGLRDRAGQRPTCPEGDRFCGVVVWKKPRDAWRRAL